jgi:hypothetical protein
MPTEIRRGKQDIRFYSVYITGISYGHIANQPQKMSADTRHSTHKIMKTLEILHVERKGQSLNTSTYIIWANRSCKWIIVSQTHITLHIRSYENKPTIPTTTNLQPSPPTPPPAPNSSATQTFTNEVVWPKMHSHHSHSLVHIELQIGNFVLIKGR